MTTLETTLDPTYQIQNLSTCIFCRKTYDLDVRTLEVKKRMKEENHAADFCSWHCYFEAVKNGAAADGEAIRKENNEKWNRN